MSWISSMWMNDWNRDGEDALGDAAGDADGRGGVALEGEEGLPDGDLDFLLDEGDDLVVAADELDRRRFAGRRWHRACRLRASENALRDVIGIVVHEGLFDQLVEVVEGEAQRGAAEGLGWRGSWRRPRGRCRPTNSRVMSVKMEVSPVSPRAKWTLVTALPRVSATSSARSKAVASPCGIGGG